MATATRSTSKLTWDDYLAFPEDGRRHEIIDGDHEERLEETRVSGPPDLVVEVPGVVVDLDRVWDPPWRRPG